jgi:hypothetical protein
MLGVELSDVLSYWQFSVRTKLALNLASHGSTGSTVHTIAQALQV